MNSEITSDYRRHKPALYMLAFGVFFVLLGLRESAAYGHLFELLPILGGNIPFFTLAVLTAYAFVRNGGTLADIGLGWPRWNVSKPKAVALIVLAAATIFIVRALVSNLAVPFLDGLGPRAETLERMAPLVGNLPLLIGLLPLMWLAVLGEELMFRGFILNFVANRLGGSRLSWVVAILVSAALFGLAHFWQGPRGMVATGLGAVVMGAGYYLVGRNLWPVIISHSVGNTLGFISIYLGE